MSSALFIVHTLRWRACPERISVARARCSSASRARTQVGRTDPAAHTATSSWCRPQCRHRGGWGSLQRGSRRAEPPPARRALLTAGVRAGGGLRPHWTRASSAGGAGETGLARGANRETNEEHAQNNGDAVALERQRATPCLLCVLDSLPLHHPRHLLLAR